MPGKDPHRPEGKTKDAEHMRALPKPKIETGKPAPDPRLEAHPTRVPAEEEVGGSRPLVESRVKSAIEEREAREEEEAKE